MALQLILDDPITRPDDSTPGNGWTDLIGGIWSVVSNTLRATVGTGIFAYPCVRPTSENHQDQKITIRTKNISSDKIYLAGLRRQSNGDVYILAAGIDSGGGGQSYAFKIIGGVATQIMSVMTWTHTAGHEYDFEFSVTGVSSTSLSVSVTDFTSSTFIHTNSTTDSAASLQKRGQYGVNAYSSTNGKTLDFDEIWTYYDDAEPAIDLTDTVFDPGVYLSKNWHWDIASETAITVRVGSYLKTVFTGTALSVAFDCSAFSGFGSGSRPVIKYSVGNGVWTVHELAAGGTDTIALVAGSVTDLPIEIHFKATAYTRDRWNTPEQALRMSFTGVTGSFALPTLGDRTVLVVGDSLTEGINNLGSGFATTDQDATQAYPYFMARGMGWEYAVSGFASNSYDQAGDGNVPAYWTGGRWSKQWSTQSFDFSGITDYFVFLGTGTNGDVDEAHVLASLEAIYAIDSSIRIWCVLPTTEGNHTAITDGFNDFVANNPSADAYLITLPITEGLDVIAASRYYTDTIHYTVQGHAIVAAQMVSQMQQALAPSGGGGGGGRRVMW